MFARRSVRLLNSGEPVLGKPAGQSYEGGPQTPMDVGDFSIYQSAYQNVGRTANRSREKEYLVSLRDVPTNYLSVVFLLSPERDWERRRVPIPRLSHIS